MNKITKYDALDVIIKCKNEFIVSILQIATIVGECHLIIR